jgi:hypothetical protein
MLAALVFLYFCNLQLFIYAVFLDAGFETFRGPGVASDDSGFQLFGVSDDQFRTGFEVDVTEIGGSGLERIKKERGSFVFEVSGDEHFHDLEEGELDGIGVFENREFEGQEFGSAASSVGVGGVGDVFGFFVKETEASVAKSGTSALGAVDFEMAAAGDDGGIRSLCR